MAAVVTEKTEIVVDPVAHISISGVHGREALENRLANARTFRAPGSRVKPLLLGAAVGAAIVYLLKR